jgi:hypothetical protein
MMVIVSSDDGETATVDIGPSFIGGMAAARDDGAFPVAVSCPFVHESEMDVSVSTPPSVTLPLEEGASASYDESSRHSIGTVGGQRGRVALEYCRPERN